MKSFDEVTLCLRHVNFAHRDVMLIDAISASPSLILTSLLFTHFPLSLRRFYLHFDDEFVCK